MNIPELYNPKFIAHFKKTGQPWSDAAGDPYFIAITSSPESTWCIIGVHHLTGLENHGQLNTFCDVLDEQGQRLNGTRINILSNNQPRPYPSFMIIDKPANEPGTNTQMHWNDTLTLWIDGLVSDRVNNLHTRHPDSDPPGNTRGHHSFYIVWQRNPEPSTEPPEEPDPPTEPLPTPPTDWHSIFTERDLKEIEFCRLYAERFNHGTDGHNIRLIVAKWAEWADGL